MAGVRTARDLRGASAVAEQHVRQFSAWLPTGALSSQAGHGTAPDAPDGPQPLWGSGTASLQPRQLEAEALEPALLPLRSHSDWEMGDAELEHEFEDCQTPESLGQGAGTSTPGSLPLSLFVEVDAAKVARKFAGAFAGNKICGAVACPKHCNVAISDACDVEMPQAACAECSRRRSQGAAQRASVVALSSQQPFAADEARIASGWG